MKALPLLSVVMSSVMVVGAAEVDLYDRVEHHSAENDGVKIHYVTVGSGPTILFVHGFPDFWYTWRHQMAGLEDRFRCVAMDTRGYNQSDKPKGVDSYSLELLQSDVSAVIDDLGVSSVILAAKPNISMPVLQFHGLDDMAVHKDRLRDTWDWIDSDYTLVTVPHVGHWVQRDAAELVTSTMRCWLLARQPGAR